MVSCEGEDNILPLPLIPPLNALRAFKVASMSASFTTAADELCVSQGAVSRHIAKLEDYLGVQLFDRSGREVKLTDAGARYASELQFAFNRIEQATMRLHSERKRDRVKLGLFPSLANTWVMTAIQEYQVLHPELAFDIVCQTMFSDVDIHSLDVMSTNTEIPRKGIEYLPLLNVVLTPACLPVIADQMAGDPEALLDQVTLHSIQRPDHWTSWLRAAGVTIQPANGARHFENSALALQAAAAGMGVAMSVTAIDNHLPMFHSVVQPFDLKLTINESYGFAWRTGIERSPLTRNFIEWMSAYKIEREKENATLSVVNDQDIETDTLDQIQRLSA